MARISHPNETKPAITYEIKQLLCPHNRAVVEARRTRPPNWLPVAPRIHALSLGEGRKDGDMHLASNVDPEGLMILQ